MESMLPLSGCKCNGNYLDGKYSCYLSIEQRVTSRYASHLKRVSDVLFISKSLCIAFIDQMTKLYLGYRVGVKGIA